MFDVTRASTFEAVQKWKNDLDSKVMLPNGAPIPVVLLANKVCILVFCLMISHKVAEGGWEINAHKLLITNYNPFFSCVKDFVNQ